MRLALVSLALSPDGSQLPLVDSSRHVGLPVLATVVGLINAALGIAIEPDDRIAVLVCHEQMSPRCIDREESRCLAPRFDPSHGCPRLLA
jgi:hypothetical protein